MQSRGRAVSKDGLILGDRAGVISCWEGRAEVGNRVKEELPKNFRQLQWK